MRGRSRSWAASSPTALIRPGSSSTIPRKGAGRAFRTFRSPSTTRWRRPAAAGYTCSAATRIARPGAPCSPDGERWRRLPPLPAARAAGGAAFAGGKVYVVRRRIVPLACERGVRVRPEDGALVDDPGRRRASTWALRHSAVASTRSAGARPASIRISLWPRCTGRRSGAGVPPPHPTGRARARFGRRPARRGRWKRAPGRSPPVHSYDVAGRRWSSLPDLRTRATGSQSSAAGMSSTRSAAASSRASP